MPTYRMGLAYDGSPFRGYARQEGLPTVQGALESALATALGKPVDTSVAGRTDAGVHARGQVVSFITDELLDTAQLVRSLNGMLGPEISVTSVDRAADGFHARFSAIRRRYRYRLSMAVAPDPLSRHEVWHVGRDLDLHGMEAVAAGVLGEHDFSSFCRAVEGKDNTRRVDEARWEADSEILTFWIGANAFCHQMVRSIVGLSYDVGRGFIDADAVGAIVESRDRARVATVAPPHGLTLWEVGYSAET